MPKLILIFVLFISGVAFADDIPKLPRSVRSPAAAFLEGRPLGPILVIHYDFDCDGVQDVAYADRSGCGHTGYCTYEVFLKRSANRYIEVGNIGCCIHIRIHPLAKGRGGIIQTFYQDSMTTYQISGRGVKQVREGSNPLHYDPISGELPKSDHAKELDVSTYSLEEFAAIAHK